MLLYTDIPETVLVAGNSSNLAAFRAGLAACLVQTELYSSVCISGIAPVDLGKVLQGGLEAQLAGQKWLVQSATDRLCAWESDLAKKATRAYCSSCGCRDLWPVTEIDD